MRRFSFAVCLVMACATGVAADPYENALSALQRGDSKLAAGLLRSLAAQGDAQAQIKLGWMYEKGEGIQQDFVRAYMWYNAAATAASVAVENLAMANRHKVASQMTATQIEEAQKMARRCHQSKFKECD